MSRGGERMEEGREHQCEKSRDGEKVGDESDA